MHVQFMQIPLVVPRHPRGPLIALKATKKLKHYSTYLAPGFRRQDWPFLEVPIHGRFLQQIFPRRILRCASARMATYSPPRTAIGSRCSWMFKIHTNCPWWPASLIQRQSWACALRGKVAASTRENSSYRPVPASPIQVSAGHLIQVSFDPHGQSLAAVSLDGRVSLWNRGGQQLGVFSAQADGGDSYFQVAFRAAGRQRLGRRRA
jgi:hypothetical protein